jgi:hypothetical protein
VYDDRLAEIKGATLDGDLKVGALVLQSPKMTLLPQLPGGIKCVLGHLWVRDLAVTYDAKHKRIRFTKL